MTKEERSTIAITKANMLKQCVAVGMAPENASEYLRMLEEVLEECAKIDAEPDDA